MLLFLKNPWVIGIGGGILSGLIVTLISRYIFSKRENREYLQKVLSANREILYAIKPSISEGLLPTQEVVMSLIFSTSRKYGIEENDMHSAEQIANDLIKEVMDSSFISAKTKTDYCTHLTQLKKPKEVVKVIMSNMEKTESVAGYRRRMFNLMSTMMGITATLMTFFSFL
jgi:hypothetical protein